jgi:hypothetical protein
VVVGKLGTATASIDEIREAMNAHAPDRPRPARCGRGAGRLPARPRRRRAHRGAAGPLGQPDAALLARLDAARRAAERLLVIEPAATDAGSAAVLAALRPVDWVVQADPIGCATLLLQLRPDALGCDAATAASLPAGLKSALLPGEGAMSDVKDISTTGGRIVAWLDMHLVDHGAIRAVYNNFYDLGGGMYRSSQPSPAQIRKYQQKFGLKSIINLRGAHGYGSYALERRPARSSAWRSTTSSCTRARRPRSRRCTPWTSSSRPSNTPRCCTASPAPTGPAWARRCTASCTWATGSRTPWPSSTGVRPLQERQDRRAGLLLRHLRGPQRQSPIGFLEWVDTEYNRLELHARFREGWASLIVDKVLHRE